MPLRVGYGDDLHRLAEGGGILLGGVRIPCNLKAIAVSDGDVLLHAVVDALLGAMALGDIGEHYPESAVAQGEDSTRFVRESLTLLHRRNGVLVNLDCTIHLEQPRISRYKEKVRQSLSRLLEMPVDKINVKAKTAEGLGPVGLGQAITAVAVVLIEIPDAH